MHHPVQTRMGRVDTRTLTTGRVDETVCTCDPGVHWTRFHRVTTVAAMPPGEWLGSEADEGRAKLRYARGTCREGKNSRFPNGNPHRNCFAQWETPRTETS
jgi:hypothetical protein